MRERQRLDAAIDTVHTLERDLSDNIELIELGEMENDVAIVAAATNVIVDLFRDRF